MFERHKLLKCYRYGAFTFAHAIALRKYVDNKGGPNSIGLNKELSIPAKYMQAEHIATLTSEACAIYRDSGKVCNAVLSAQVPSIERRGTDITERHMNLIKSLDEYAHAILVFQRTTSPAKIHKAFSSVFRADWNLQLKLIEQSGAAAMEVLEHYIGDMPLKTPKLLGIPA